MPYSVLTRAFWHRILYGDTPTLAKVDGEVTIQQALEGAATYVMEFQPTGMQTGLFQQGQDVTCDVVDTEGTAGIYQTRRVFTGVVDPTSAAAYPNSVTSTCTGNLRKLRKTRTTDYDMTGKTDTQVVKDILTFCGIDYDPANITGDDYVLGEVKPVKWKKLQSGLELLQELDTVFGYATIELGDGTVMRFPYSKVPSEYSDTIYGTSGTVKNYRAGTVGLTFYGNEREHGSMDEIRNFWRVTGVSWEGAEGAADEGCTYTVYAEAFAENSLLGSGVYQSDELSSELIQSTAMAYKQAARLMRWYNRTPDTVRIEGGNDPKVGVGHLVGVRDPAYGIELDTTQRYLVMNCNRHGDFMTLDCIGGGPGEEGTITSAIDKCCGTQKEDGTCEATPGDGSGDNEPNIPDIPDLVECDPLVSPNCIPDDETEGDGTNFIDPLIGCTTEGSLFVCDPDSEDYDTCLSQHQTNCTGIPPDINDVCTVSDSGTEWWLREEIESGSGWSCACEVHVPWQTHSGTPYFRKNGSGDIDAVAAINSPEIPGGVLLYWSEVSDPDLMSNFGTVRVIGSPAVFSISGVVTFNSPGAQLAISVEPLSAGVPQVTNLSATLYADPGFHISIVGGDTYDLGLVLSTEWEPPLFTGSAPANSSAGALQYNNGGYVSNSSPVGLGSPTAFTFSFDMGAHSGWGVTTGTTGVGGGHIEHLDYINPAFPLPGEPGDPPALCPDVHGEGHAIHIVMNGGTNPVGSFDAPAVILEGIVVGFDTCEENPDYVEDVEDATV